MTVIVFDGKTVAADRQATTNGLMRQTTKIFREPSREVLAACGNEAATLVMLRWYRDGADPAKWPACQGTEKWVNLIVVKPDGVVHTYEQAGPYPITERAPWAWGYGRELAIGAMAAGACARRAVEIANTFSDGCGFGVDAIDLEMP